MAWRDWVAILIIALGLGWDAYAIPMFKNTSDSFSWRLYCVARLYPMLPFMAGYLTHFLFPGVPVHVFVFLVGCGHIFGTMRGAN